jgi:translation initiation factor IF-2
MSKGIDELAREHAPRAIELLADIMETAVEDRDKIRAAEAILDRGYGKPAQAIIQVPANRRQAALLAGMTDEALVAIIEHKQLPRLAPAQTMVNVEPDTVTLVNGLHAIGREVKRKIASGDPFAPLPQSSHGPSDSFPDADPLLL